MLKNLLYSQLVQNLDYEPTPGQEILLQGLAGYISASSPNEIVLIKGFAGTGKTTIVNSLVKTLSTNRIRSVLLAPTGRAAKVLSSFTSAPAHTIHKWIYRQQSSRDGMGKFVLDRNLLKNTYFIVDEASMIGDQATELSIFGTGDLLTDLLRFVESGENCRLILIGDTAQLPPVGLEISPALNAARLARHGFEAIEFLLSDVVRQAENSGILKLATSLRRALAEGKLVLPRFGEDEFPDVKRIGGADLLPEIEACYSKYGEEGVMVISRSNKRANRYNEGIRKQILWREEELNQGDLLMVVKNNYFWKDENKHPDFIANGDILKIERILKQHELYGFRFADARLSMPDYNGISLEGRLMLDVLSSETASLSRDAGRNLYESVLADYEDESDIKKRSKKVMDDPWFNSLQVKFAYAVTCHKAQGGQWKAVFVDQGYFTPEMITVEYLRWLYTAFTRAEEKLYLVGFPDEHWDK